MKRQHVPGDVIKGLGPKDEDALVISCEEEPATHDKTLYTALINDKLHYVAISCTLSYYVAKIDEWNRGLDNLFELLERDRAYAEEIRRLQSVDLFKAASDLVKAALDLPRKP